MNLFNHHFADLSGARIYLDHYRNQPFLIVNVATESRFVPQLARLQQLHTLLSQRGLVIVAIPGNDFGDEPRDEKQIGQYLRANYPVSFVVTARYAATGPDAHPLFVEMLRERGSTALPRASFTKYLFNRRGQLAERFAPEVVPDDPMLMRHIEREIGGV